MNKKAISIIHEDEELMVVNKRSGLLSVPVDNTRRKDLCSILNQEIETRRIKKKVFPCHRLDKETSGVIIFAKGKENQALIMDQFRQRKVKKTYIAFVHGRIKQTKGVIKSNMQGSWPYRRREKNKLAVTNFELIYNTDNFSVMRLEPVTGRTNQIRIQFRDSGHPLLGERRFAYAKDWPIKFRRVALHSCSIEISHPLTGERIRFQAPMPDDMEGFLKTHKIADLF